MATTSAIWAIIPAPQDGYKDYTGYICKVPRDAWHKVDMMVLKDVHKFFNILSKSQANSSTLECGLYLVTRF